MRRFYVQTLPLDGSSMKITGEEFHHLVHVVRFSKGEEIELIASNGFAKGFIQEIHREEAVVILQKVSSRDGMEYSIHLIQGMPKIKKMDEIVEKGTEIGIHFFHPVFMTRSFSSLSASQLQEKQKRWQRIATSAVKQSKTPHIPIISEVTTFASFFDHFSVSSRDMKIVAYEAERTQDLFSILPKGFHEDSKEKHIWLCVGPEGGITDQEISILKEHGFYEITLGNTILRTETAGYFFAGLVQYILEFSL